MNYLLLNGLILTTLSVPSEPTIYVHYFQFQFIKLPTKTNNNFCYFILWLNRFRFNVLYL